MTMTLSRLWKLMQAIDTRYWECKVEITCENPAANSSGNKSEKNNNNKLSLDKGKCSSQSKQNNNNNSSSSSSQNKGNSLEPKTSTPDYASKLGKDSKLTPQERLCRINKNLCLCCGASSHQASNCPKCQAATKARASKTTPAMQESNLTPKHCCSEAKKIEQSLRLQMTQGLC